MANTTTFGATIVPTPNRSHERDQLRPFDESPALTPSVSRDASAADFCLEQTPSIQSPFYTHPPASHERVASRNAKLDVNILEKDLEGGNATPLTPADEENPFTKRHHVHNNAEDAMWPSKLALKQKKKAEKKEKFEKKGMIGCAPLRRQWGKMTKRNRILVQVGIALLIIGIAVAIGVGISISVKGTYYVSDGSSKTVGQ